MEQYKVKPGCLYIRGCYVEPNDEYWLLLGDFFNFVELWDGVVLCPPKKQIPNESKLFQINNSLRKSFQDCSTVSLGVSYVIKGAKQFDALKENQSHIVKSLSGVRSVVVDENDYMNWCTNNLDNIPVDCTFLLDSSESFDCSFLLDSPDNIPVDCSFLLDSPDNIPVDSSFLLDSPHSFDCSFLLDSLDNIPVDCSFLFELLDNILSDYYLGSNFDWNYQNNFVDHNMIEYLIENKTVCCNFDLLHNNHNIVVG